MRNRPHWLSQTVFFLLLAFPLLAFEPIATVTCAEPFLVDGRAIPVSGITSVTLTVGNEVATATAPAVLYFSDGSSVKLASSSRVKLIGSDTQPKLVLLAGSLDYKVVLGSNLSVTSLDLERKAKQAARAVTPPASKAMSVRRGDDATLSVLTR